MKALTFIQKNKLISDQIISSAENKLGLFFPEDYREFLLKYNGGLSEEGVFSIPGRGQSSIIFLGVDTNENHSDLIKIFYDYKYRLPDMTIPFGFDPGGNLICLSFINDNWSVYFWDHEKENNPPSLNNMVLLSESFSEFVDSLEVEESEAW